MKKMKNKLTYKIAIILLVTLLVFSCKENAHSNNESNSSEKEHVEKKSHQKVVEAMLSARQFEVMQMKIDTISERTMENYIEANGELDVPPQNEAVITSMVGANIVSIEVIEGDKVSKNQVVAYLAHPNIIQKQTDYLSAFSRSQFLKKDFERQKKLYEAGVGSGLNFQKSESEYLASKGMERGLEAQLKQFNINAASVRNGVIYQKVALKSPIEGFVQRVGIKTGQYVEPQTNLFEVVNTHHVHADLMVFEKDVDKVKKGQVVSFIIQSSPNKKFAAEIYSVSKTFEKNPKAVHVHAEIENKEGNLIPGMYIQGKIATSEMKTLALPESAIGEDDGKFYAFKAEMEGEDWSFKPIEVKIGVKDNNWVSVVFLTAMPPNIKYAFNNGYYLMAEAKKGDAEHSH